MALFPMCFFLAGTWDYFGSGVLNGLPLMLLLLLLVHFTVPYIRSSMLGWKGDAEPLLSEGSIDLGGLFGVKGVVATFAILLIPIQAIYVFSTALPANYSTGQRLLLSVPFDYWEAYLVTAIWMFAYSMYKVMMVGRRPMALRDFADDRSLGLRAFGRVSLRLTTVYLVLILVGGAVSVANGTAGTGIQLFMLVLAVLGIGLFIVPQVALHRKMVLAKKEAFGWINPQYAELVRAIRVNGIMAADSRAVERFAAVESIRRDVGLIHGWPFDVGIVARLSAVLLSVLAILLSAILRSFLGF